MKIVTYTYVFFFYEDDFYDISERDKWRCGRLIKYWKRQDNFYLQKLVLNT